VGQPRVGTITQPAGGPGPGPVQPRAQPPPSPAHLCAPPCFYPRDIEMLARSLPILSSSLPSFCPRAAILIEPRYERIERSIGIDLREDLWSRTRYYHSPSIITRETNDAARCFTVAHHPVATYLASSQFDRLAFDRDLLLLLLLLLGKGREGDLPKWRAATADGVVGFSR